jgi:hypothetical protein
MTFKVALRGDPEIHRIIEIQDDDTLYNFAALISKAFDFFFDHAFGFYSSLDDPYEEQQKRFELFTDMGDGNPGALGVKEPPVAEAFPQIGAKMLYLFDYGDEWHFILELVEAREIEEPPAPIKMRRKHRKIVKRVGIAPPQYPT